LKQIGYVMHALHADGTHDSRFKTATGTVDLDFDDFPDMYGPMD
jgi:hypothetical protein